jgi:hypothetical protein
MLILKTVKADMTAYGGFRWPESGPVEALGWDPRPVCGGGLHGLPWGEGDGLLLDWSEDAKWLVFDDHDSPETITFDSKCKTHMADVVFCGNRAGSTEYIRDHGGAGRAIVGSTATAGDSGTATAGYRGTATAGNWGTATAGNWGTATAGNGGTATAGDRGTATAGDGGTATAGDWGTATAGDEGTATAGYEGTATAGYEGTATAGYRGTATAGYRGTATAGDWGTATAGDRGTATAGDWGTATAGDGGTATAGDWGTATAGDEGTATAGDGGTLIIRWWDGQRYRLSVGYVGENGIEANKAYRLDGQGAFVAVEG